MIFREVPVVERPECANIVKSWGYPREITDADVQGTWIKALEPGNGKRLMGLAWFTPGPDPRSVSLHATGLSSLQPLGTEKNLHALEVIAGLMGADRLYACLMPEHAAQGVPAAAMHRYLRIRGWHEDEWGSYREIGAD